MVDGSIERWFRTRKILIKTPIPPARYVNETVHESLGQCKRGRDLASSDESEVDEDKPIEESTYSAQDQWSKKGGKLVKIKKKS